MTSRAPILAMLAGAALVPFVALWPLVQRHGEAMAPAFDLWSARMFWVTILLTLGAFIALRDRWLGAAVGLGALDLFLLPIASWGRSTVTLFAFGALGLVWVRTWSASARAMAGHVLGAVAILESLVMLGQMLGVNPLWGSWIPGPSVMVTGTLGNTAFAAMLVAMTGPFAPVAVWGLFVAVLIGAQSKIALLAFTVACGVRLLPVRWAAGAIVGALAVFLLGLVLTPSGHARLWIWAASLKDLTPFGTGLGLAPIIQTPGGIGAAYDPAGWQNAHSEPIQWIRERGLFGACLLGAFLVTLRRKLQGPRVALAGFAAVAVVALAQSPFHHIATSPLAVIIVGLATPLTSDPTGA